MAQNTTDTVVTEVGRGYLRLQMTPDVGPVRAGGLIQHFGSPDAVFGASRAELERVRGIGSQASASIFQARDESLVEREIERAAALGVRIICREDHDYPQSLIHMNDPPICLYARGTLEPTDCVAISIVGTRRCSHYGCEQARRFAQLLGRAGFTVVSGLARGIDSHAHRAAIECGARTIAVLGSGLANIYPPEHQSLADEIAESGAVISEMTIDSQPDSKNFPRRNRIIAGLSLGVLVVEAGRRSGALITARLATDYNREVFAIPGRVDQTTTTEGVHSLIRDGGAKLVTCLEDILDELKDVGGIMKPDEAFPSSPASSSTPLFDTSSVGASGSSSTDRVDGDGNGRSKLQMPGLSPDERAILAALKEKDREVEQICAATRLSVARVNSTLTALQLKGLVARLPGNRFALRRNRSHG